MGGYLKLGASAATSEFCFVYIPHSSIRISAQKPSKNICLSSASEIFLPMFALVIPLAVFRSYLSLQVNFIQAAYCDSKNEVEKQNIYNNIL